MTLDGEWINEPNYAAVGPFSEGRAAFSRLDKGTERLVHGWVDVDGNEVAFIERNGELARPFSHGVALATRPLRGFDPGGKRIFRKPEYWLRWGFVDGLAVVEHLETKEVLMIGTNGEPVESGLLMTESRFLNGYAAACIGTVRGVCDPSLNFWRVGGRIAKRSTLRTTGVPGVLAVHTEQGTDQVVTLDGRTLWSRTSQGAK